MSDYLILPVSNEDYSNSLHPVQIDAVQAHA
jgi:hypothetical protein